MKYFGVEVYDAKFISPFVLDENQSLESQDFLLDSEIGGLDFLFRQYEFFLTIAWYGDKDDLFNENNVFVIRIYEPVNFEGRKTFFKKTARTDFGELKKLLHEAVEFMEKMKTISDKDIQEFPDLNYWSIL
ncbi:hypothetical protein SIO70_20250 [Chitinophaga sancti]|uniref:hypothetical protein n=1 Tax=Chitinophaga sancti TaxID=1004 RepID=UPI002A748A11|nr:hypothetical protein [Chitinophaga sancti]WPQ60687.1 hypothetical protein SIO70_20250 [Chitinophaga sancti]